MSNPEDPDSNAEPIIRRYSLVRAESLRGRGGGTLGQRIVLAYRQSFSKRTVNQPPVEAPTDASASEGPQPDYGTQAVPTPEQELANPNITAEAPQENDQS